MGRVAMRGPRWLVVVLLALVAACSCLEPRTVLPQKVSPVCGASDHPTSDSPMDGVCRDLDIRYNVRNLELLRNCTVIEGFLRITLIEYVPQSVYDNYRFPELREITGYFLMFKVFGLESMKNMFPNLAVIRGQEVIFDKYALFIHEMRDLQELGLIGLTNILNGSVRLTKNFRLCYVSTIDWSKIATNVTATEHEFDENREETMCPNYCDDSCKAEDGKKHCWSSSHGDCQKNFGCNCTKNQPCTKNGTCCHEYCLGGCSGPTSRHCYVCKNYSLGQDCKPKCPPNTYILAGRRCLTDKECLSLPPLSPYKIQNYVAQNTPKLLRYPRHNECVYKCPPHYMVNETSVHRPEECVPCNDFCPKVCNKTRVYSIKDSKQLENCTKIQGDLDILLHTIGDDLDAELTKNLGLIKEVTGYIKIMRSYSLINLNFLKSLEVIGGERLIGDKYSLVIVDNPNLEALFSVAQMEKMKIHNGSISINYNKMLCSKIVEFFFNTTKRPKENIAELQNGVSNPCTELNIQYDIVDITPYWAKFEVEPAVYGDVNYIRNYMIWYKEVTSPVKDKREGRSLCSLNGWQRVVSSDEVKAQINITKNNGSFQVKPERNIIIEVPGLKPYTVYATLVSAVTLKSAGYTIDSNILYFRTSPSEPSVPANVKVEALSPHELQVSWQPPVSPNGIVQFYKVFYTTEDSKTEALLAFKDFCKHSNDPIPELKISPVTKPLKAKEVNINSSCCSCAANTTIVDIVDEDDTLKESTFTNAVINSVFSTQCTDQQKPPASTSTTTSTAATNNGRRKRRSASVGKDFDDPVTQFHIKKEPDDPNFLFPDFLPRLNKNSSSMSTMPQLVEVNGTNITLPNLMHYQSYKIHVLACQDVLCSAEAEIFGQTLPDAAADNLNSSLIHAVVLPNKTSEVLVTWKPPEKPNGRILFYIIKLVKMPGIEEKFCVNGDQTREHHFKNLSPGNYSIYVKAMSLAAVGNFSQAKHIFIPDIEIDEDSSKLIIGVTVGPLTIFAVIVFIFCYIRHHWKKEAEMMVSQNPQYMHTEDLYCPDEWEIPRECVHCLKSIGQGSFGTVYEGLLDDPETKTSQPVAIKMLGDKADFFERLKILKEASTMKAIHCHHVVQLLGVVSVGHPALIVMELMIKGDLRDYLRKCRLDDETHPDLFPPTVNEIRQMAGEIADGMAYMAHWKIVHRDLAARNCLVAEDGTVKIADFGMARDVYMTDYYRKDNKALLPIRWMAPESLMDGTFSTKSDVWSYGIVLWEMVTLAEQPYQGLGNEEVLRYVSDGKVMNAPIGCPQDFYEIMKKCWAYNHKKRPTFLDILHTLAPHLNEKFQRLSFYYQNNTRHEEEHTDGDDVQEDLARLEEGIVSLDSLNRRSRGEDSSVSGSYKSSKGSSTGLKEDSNTVYRMSSPATIAPTPNTPDHVQSLARNDQSDSDSEAIDQAAMVERDVEYMRTSRDASTSSERLKLLPDSLALPGRADTDEYTIMSPPATSFSPLFPSFSTSHQSTSPLWQEVPNEDLRYRGSSGFPRNGTTWSLSSPNKLASLVSYAPEEGIKSTTTTLMSYSSDQGIKSTATSPTGSKDSNSSGEGRFYTANGHGPFTQQQTALC